jgi:hypothetical protein
LAVIVIAYLIPIAFFTAFDLSILCFVVYHVPLL